MTNTTQTFNFEKYEVLDRETLTQTAGGGIPVAVGVVVAVGTPFVLGAISGFSEARGENR